MQDRNGNINNVNMLGKDPSEMRKAPGYIEAVPGVNTPDISLPAVNPPVPNRAWTEMKRKLECRGSEGCDKKDATK